MEQEGGVVEEFEEEFGAQENDCFLLCKVNFSLGSVQAELKIVVELGNLVPRKNLVLQKVFIGFEIFTKLNS